MNKKNIFCIILTTIALALFTSKVSYAGPFDWLIVNKDIKPLTASRQDWSFENIDKGIRSFNISDKRFSNYKMAFPEQDSKEAGLLKINMVRIEPVETLTVVATAYSSTVDQTDSTPFITASGTRVKDGIIAANFLPFGTAIKIPELYGDKVFIVTDRMNKRYWYNIDLWFPERHLAKEFGVKRVKIEVLPL
jgi:3D (Asp-Asp-Asp) domain-containing protein